MPSGQKTISIDGYAIHHSCGGDGWMITITCLYGGSAVGYLRFYQKGQIPLSTWMDTLVELIYPSKSIDIRKYIETLRYEKPLYIYANWAENNVLIAGRLMTSIEPVGEQEGV